MRFSQLSRCPERRTAGAPWRTVWSPGWRAITPERRRNRRTTRWLLLAPAVRRRHRADGTPAFTGSGSRTTRSPSCAIEVHGRSSYRVPDRSVTTEAPAGPEPELIHGERTLYDNPWVKLSLVDVEPPLAELSRGVIRRLPQSAMSERLGWNAPHLSLGTTVAFRHMGSTTWWATYGNGLLPRPRQGGMSFEAVPLQVLCFGESPPFPTTPTTRCMTTTQGSAV